MLCRVWGYDGERYPVEMTFDDEKPAGLGRPGPDGKRLRPMSTFPVSRREDAALIYQEMLKKGISNHGCWVPGYEPGGRLWRAHGSPHYMKIQAQRLGVTDLAVKKCLSDPIMHRLNGLICELNRKYHAMPKQNGVAITQAADSMAIRATLKQCEEDSGRLHALAAAAQAMIDEAYAAFAMEPDFRYYRVQCDFDEPAAMPVTTQTTDQPPPNGEPSKAQPMRQKTRASA